MKANPLVSVCVLSWNTKNETQTCLESIRKLNYPSKEIVVVDNGSSDGSKDYLKNQPDIIYVDLPENLGFTGGQIAALDKVNGAYIFLVNSDAVVDPDWLDIAISIMEKETAIGALGGRAYTWREDEKPYDTTNEFYSYQVINPARGYATTLQAGSLQTDVDSISGAGVLIRKAAIDKVGYFDDRFFAYFEETDLFARMQRAGYRIVYEPSLHMWHQIARSTKGKPYFYFYHMHRNRFIFALKNFDKPHARRFFNFYIADGLRAWVRYLRHRDLDNKARADSLVWNIKHLSATLQERSKVQALGPSYSTLLGAHRVPSDITVIIPCFNYESYVGQAIDSVLSQSLKPSRILVIDDGSTDGSVDVIKTYRKRGVELIVKHNEGVVATKNLGIRQSETSWTVFLDADDIMEPDYLKVLYNKANKTRADVVYTDMRYFGVRDGTMQAGRFNLKRLLHGNFIHNSALISTSLLKQVGGYKTEMNGGYEDWELYITLAEHGANFDYVAKPLLHYRQHDLGSSRNAEAEVRAKQLWEMVHTLHAGTYRKYNGLLYKLQRGFQEVFKHPVLPVLAITLIPVGFAYGLKCFAAGFRDKILHYLRTYAEGSSGTKQQEQAEESPDQPQQP